MGSLCGEIHFRFVSIVGPATDFLVHGIHGKTRNLEQRISSSRFRDFAVRFISDSCILATLGDF